MIWGKLKSADFLYWRLSEVDSVLFIYEIKFMYCQAKLTIINQFYSHSLQKGNFKEVQVKDKNEKV